MSGLPGAITGILDISAGNRAVWFDKRHPGAVYVDIRPAVKPDIVADSGLLPFADGAFRLVVFDPPHVNSGANGKMTPRYGHHTAAEIRAIIGKSAKEAWRCSRDGSLMALKWNDHDQSLETVLALLHPYWAPLFGHKISEQSARKRSTYWLLLQRGRADDLLWCDT